METKTTAEKSDIQYAGNQHLWQQVGSRCKLREKIKFRCCRCNISFTHFYGQILNEQEAMKRLGVNVKCSPKCRGCNREEDFCRCYAYEEILKRRHMRKLLKKSLDDVKQ